LRDATAGGGGNAAAAGAGSAWRRFHGVHAGSSDEIAGGFFMTTVPSDVRVQAATGRSPQQTAIMAIRRIGRFNPCPKMAFRP
jgi:hypothetical protein